MLPVRDLVKDILGIKNSSPSSKTYSIILFEEKKRRLRYFIYKRIDASSYYGYNNEDVYIFKKIKWST
jgi:hypothetical protein